MQLYEQCYKCKSCRTVSGDTHIQCVTPDEEMTGNPHGIIKGWFFYPTLFDPVWGTKECSNFQPKDTK